MRLIRSDGALTIRDIEDDVLTEKEHLWAQPQAVEAGAATGVLHRHGHRQRAHRHAQDL